MLRRVLDRFFAALALLVLRAFFRSVEVEGRDKIPAGRPILLVANHFNGFVDPVMIVRVVGRLPRFLAKAPLWRMRVVRPFLSLAGMLPIHRPEDGTPGNNSSTFAASHAVLRRRGIVAIFPEGLTHDSPALARIRTGAARIALGARAAGAEGLVIVPVGLAFDDKLALRSRVLAQVGEPLDLDDEIRRFAAAGPAAGEEDQDAVRALTDEIEHRLRAVSPDYRDFREARVLGRAAEIAQRSQSSRDRHGVPLAAQERLAQRLAYAPVEARTQLMDALARYHLDLEVAGLRDHQLVPGYTPRGLLREFVSTAAVLTLLAPFALVGAAVNLIPYWCVQAAGRATRQPIAKGSVRFFVALVVFPLVWVAVAALDGRSGVMANVAVFAVLPLTGLVAVAAFERLVRAYRAWRGWQALRDRRALLDDILADRERLVATVEAAATQAPDAPPPGGHDHVTGGLADATD